MSFPNIRLRRNRSDVWVRDLIAEINLTNSDLIQPLFVLEGDGKKEEIKTLPGIYRYSIDELLKEIEILIKLGIKAVALFPYVDASLKTADCKESYNEQNLICRTLREIKKNFGNKIGLIADVALDPYNLYGHDGIVRDDQILNDETLEILAKQAIIQTEAGADIVAPSDMMDGRIGFVRNALEKAGFVDTKILSYTAKYASNLYGPFRDAIGSSGNIAGRDKKTYQMDYRNRNEAVLEADLDVSEGADMLMVKPAGFYLDIIRDIKNKHKLPLFAYQVSGEYAMLKLAAKNGIISGYDQAVLESLIAIKRSGADAILTYSAKDVASKL